LFIFFGLWDTKNKDRKYRIDIYYIYYILDICYIIKIYLKKRDRYREREKKIKRKKKMEEESELLKSSDY